MAQIFELDRNDKCPCGSGKKYKKCCMDRVEEQKRRILKAIGEGLSAYGMAAVHLLSVMLGLDVGDQMPKTEYMAKLMRQMWEETEGEKSDGFSDDYMEDFQELLLKKPGLKLVRVPGEWLLDEKLKNKESMDSLWKKICSRDFLEPLLLQIAKSIKSEVYSEEELKTLLWAFSSAADEKFADIFIEPVFNASIEEIMEARKKVNKWYEEYKFDFKFDFGEVVNKIEGLVQECPNFGNYMGELFSSKFKDEAENLVKEAEKIDIPLFAIYDGLLEFYIKHTESLGEKVNLENMLWEGNRREYFLEGIQRWLSKEMVNAIESGVFTDDKEVKKQEEKRYREMNELAGVLLYPYTPFQFGLLGKLYASLILNFSRNIPRKVDESDLILNNISELFEEEFVEKYAKYLEDKGLKKAAGYVIGCFYRVQQILKEKG